jgi:exopolyphosphatase/guanosine-5'-triphosphate,3'-diphosphate pyrophosphatase
MGQDGGRSLDIGAVRFTERFLKSDPVTDEEYWAAQDAIDSALEALKPWRESLPGGAELVAVAGTATTLAAWQLDLAKFDASRIDGLFLSRGDVHRLVSGLKWRTVAERRALPGVEEGRADVLLAGALILWRAMEVLGFPGATISTRGLRYGVMALD